MEQERVLVRVWRKFSKNGFHACVVRRFVFFSVPKIQCHSHPTSNKKRKRSHRLLKDDGKMDEFVQELEMMGGSADVFLC